MVSWYTGWTYAPATGVRHLVVTVFSTGMSGLGDYLNGTVSSSIGIDRMLGGEGKEGGGEGNEWHLAWVVLEKSFTSIPGSDLPCTTHVT